MPVKKVFIDDEGNEMLFHINLDNKLYLEISNKDFPDYPGWIVLERDDVEDMILMLTDELNKPKVE